MRLFVADQLAAPAFQRRRIAAQHIGFGEKPDDVAVAEGIDDGQRFDFGAVEGEHRLLDRGRSLHSQCNKFPAYIRRPGFCAKLSERRAEVRDNVP
jgi:hypothetical protein